MSSSLYLLAAIGFLTVDRFVSGGLAMLATSSIPTIARYLTVTDPAQPSFQILFGLMQLAALTVLAIGIYRRLMDRSPSPPG